MRVTDVFLKAGIQIPGVPIATDHLFKTTCVTCKEEQTLNQCSTQVNGDVTNYKCKNGCDKDIITVYKFGSLNNSSGNAYRLKDYVVKSSSDLFMILPNGSQVLIPK